MATSSACSEETSEKSGPGAVHAPEEQPIETLYCQQVDVTPATPLMPWWSSGEELRRYQAKPGSKLRLARFAFSYGLSVPSGAILTTRWLGYGPEETLVIGVERRTTFNSRIDRVDCIDELADNPHETPP